MQSVLEKAKSIRLLILDVDGVLTSGLVYYGTQGFEMRGFHLHDGLGMKLLQQAGVKIAVISGKNSEVVARRLKELHVEHAYLGHEDKRHAYTELKQILQLKDSEIAYMGDDLPDLPLLRQAGLAITVPQAPDVIRQHVDLTTKKPGGEGAVREVCELIMTAQDRYESVLQSFLK